MSVALRAVGREMAIRDCRRTGGDWLGLAETGRDWRRLAEVVLAFVDWLSVTDVDCLFLTFVDWLLLI